MLFVLYLKGWVKFISRKKAVTKAIKGEIVLGEGCVKPEQVIKDQNHSGKSKVTRLKIQFQFHGSRITTDLPQLLFLLFLPIYKATPPLTYNTVYILIYILI